MLAMISLLVLLTLLMTPTVYSALVNVTVDDASPEISYFPNATAGWVPVTLPAEPCGGCGISFRDPNMLTDRTYHDGTSNRQTRKNVLGLNFTFFGTAIYAQLVVPGNDHPPVERLDTEFYFYIDGERVGEYAKPAPDLSQVSDDPSNAYLFNHTVYANDTLPNGRHEFSIQAGRENGPEALILFDSLIYSRLEDDDNTTTSLPNPTETPDSAPAGQRSNTTLIIILATVIPIVALSILFTLCFLLHRRQRRARRALEQEKRNAVAQWERDRRHEYPPGPGDETEGTGSYISSRPPSYTSDDGLFGVRGGGMVMRWLSLSARSAERGNTIARRSEKGGRV